MANQCDKCGSYRPTYGGWGECELMGGGCYVDGLSGRFCPDFKAKKITPKPIQIKGVQNVKPRPIPVRKI